MYKVINITYKKDNVKLEQITYIKTSISKIKNTKTLRLINQLEGFCITFTDIFNIYYPNFYELPFCSTF